jgi:hypothetical protein
MQVLACSNRASFFTAEIANAHLQAACIRKLSRVDCCRNDLLPKSLMHTYRLPAYESSVGLIVVEMTHLCNSVKN